MPMTPTAPGRPANRLLALLPAADYRQLSVHLQAVPLPARQVLYKARSPIDYVYFPNSGFVSAMAVMEDGAAIEVATIGNEGMSGLTAFIGDSTSPYEVMVQVSGDGLRVAADVLHKAAAADGPLRDLLVRYNTAFATQVSYAVACNGLHKVEQRCCRWLLMTADRVGSDDLPLTHEFLGIMLGVRRASVTDVLNPLQVRGLVQNGRGLIRILDRPAMEATSCECYRAVRDEFARLFGM
jgi:CRP-like cAMP-binding protein